MARTREEIAADGQSAPPMDRRKKKRVSVYIGDDGLPEWNAVPDEHKRLLGFADGSIAPPPEPEPPARIEPEMVGMVFGMLVNIEAAVISGRMDLPMDATRAALEPAPPIRSGINEAGARVLNKYAGSLGKYQDEIVLAGLIIAWQSSAFIELRRMRAARPEPEPIPAPPDKHESIQAEPAEPVAV